MVYKIGLFSTKGHITRAVPWATNATISSPILKVLEIVPDILEKNAESLKIYDKIPLNKLIKNLNDGGILIAYFLLISFLPINVGTKQTAFVNMAALITSNSGKTTKANKALPTADEHSERVALKNSQKLG